MKHLKNQVDTLQKTIRQNEENYSNRLASELKRLQDEKEKQMILRDEINQKQLDDQSKNFEKFREQIQESSALEIERLKEHLQSVQMSHKQTLENLKVDYGNEKDEKDLKYKDLEDKYRTMEKMHSEALTALRNEHAIEIEKMEEDKNNIMIQHVDKYRQWRKCIGALTALQMNMP